MVGVIGVSVAALGLLMLTRMDLSTDYASVIRNMSVLGVGLGATMPVFTLAVQNAVERRFLGTATSSIQFFRQMGGVLGSAIFGSILANRFAPALREALPPDVVGRLTPEQIGRLDNPQVLMQAESGVMSALDPLAQEMLQQAIRIALAVSLHDVFVLSASVVAVAIVAAFFVQDVPLGGFKPPGRAELKEESTEAAVGS
jgi:hypothetical protein